MQGIDSRFAEQGMDAEENAAFCAAKRPDVVDSFTRHLCRNMAALPTRALYRASVMIAFEVTLNGKRICIAGAEDLAVLTTVISAGGKLGKKTAPPRPGESSYDIYYSVGGLTGRPDPKKDVHLRWKSVVPLNVGDVVQVRILKTKKVNRAVLRTKAREKKT
jgi:hypothetical protein